MHNVEDVKKMNALSNAGALGRLIRKIQFSHWQEFRGIEPICLCQSAPLWSLRSNHDMRYRENIGIGGAALQT